MLLGNAATNDTPEAEACFRKAIEIAGNQGALLFELRAATSLAWLLDLQNKREAAHGAPAPIYARFTEGFDTPDLADARALLDGLS